MLAPNWFFAFPMDGAFLRQLPDPPSSFRRFHEEDVHLTLAFLGGVGQSAAERSLAALDARLASTPVPSMLVSLGEVVPMGSRSRYTALSALLEQGRPEATACITALRDLLTETANGRREKREAKPHVTIARPRGRATDADREAGLVWAAQLDLGATHATLDRVALYTWSERRQARLFRIVAERRLAPAPSAPADPADRGRPGPSTHEA